MVAMQKWEYQTVPTGSQLGPSSTRDALNKLGDEGWEFVAVISGEPLSLMIFKRPKP